MKQSMERYVRGALAAVIAFALYMVSILLFVAILLFIVSIEESGKNITSATMSVTQLAVLLSQGAGFHTDAMRVTIIPLLLTGLLIWLITVVVRRCKAVSAKGYGAGLVAWLILTLLCTINVTGQLVDPVWLVCIKTLVVFSIGFGIAALLDSETAHRYIDRVLGLLSPQMKHALVVGAVIAGAILGTLLVLGALTMIIWIIVNHQAIGNVFNLVGMGVGSRIITTIASLIWLPNLIIWAMAWLVGPGFHIGDLGQFTLWVGQSTNLPAIPLFGMFPQPISVELIRVLFVMIPFIAAVVFGVLAMMRHEGFGLNPKSVVAASSGMALIASLAYPAAAFCFAAVLVAFGAALLFVLANGSLGTNRLASVGVSVMSGTQDIGHAVALGLAAVWVIALMSVAIAFLIWRVKGRPQPASTDDAAEVSGKPGESDSTVSAASKADDEIEAALAPPAKKKRTFGSRQFKNPDKEPEGTEVFEAAKQGEDLA